MMGRSLSIALLLAAGLVTACNSQVAQTNSPCTDDPDCADQALVDEPIDGADGTDDAADPSPINPVRPLDTPAEQPLPTNDDDPDANGTPPDEPPSDPPPADGDLDDLFIDLDGLYDDPGSTSAGTSPYNPFGTTYTGGSTWDLLSLWLDGMTMGLLDPSADTGGSSYTYLELMCLDGDTPDSVCRSRYGN